MPWSRVKYLPKQETCTGSYTLVQFTQLKNLRIRLLHVGGQYNYPAPGTWMLYYVITAEGTTFVCPLKNEAGRYVAWTGDLEIEGCDYVAIYGSVDTDDFATIGKIQAMVAYKEWRPKK